MIKSNETAPKRPLSQRFIRSLKKHWQYYILLLPALAYFLVFCYGPMYGAQIAFRNFNARGGITGSPWVGLAHFTRFFNSPYFLKLIRNTLTISLYSLVAGFPFPIILALSLNELKNQKFKKFAQTVTYAPYFISVVVMCGMLISFMSPSTGIINKAITSLGKTACINDVQRLAGRIAALSRFISRLGEKVIPLIPDDEENR